MKTFIIIGCSPRQDYDFPLPMTATIWKQLLGWEPVCMLYSTESTWRKNPSASYVLDTLDQKGIRYHFIGDLSGQWNEHTPVQNARQHAAALDFDDDDFLVTGDADLWPLRKDYYDQIDYSKKMTFWFSNAYNYAYHCSCHIGARASVWRDVMGLKVTGEILSQMQVTLDRDVAPARIGLSTADAGMVEWNSDEVNTSRLIRAKSWYPHQCQMIERKRSVHGILVDRIDRATWKGWWPGAIDAHLLRPPQFPENWPRVFNLIRQVSPSVAEWADTYRNTYLAHG